MSRAKGLGAGLLVLTALIWGTAFVAQSMGMDHVGPCAFNAARNFIGCAALLPVIFVSGRRRTGALEKSGAKAPSAASFAWRNPVLLTGGVLCGLFLGVASLLQQAGLQSTGAGKAGFLTSLYIVLVPVLGIFLGRRAGGKVWQERTFLVWPETKGPGEWAWETPWCWPVRCSSPSIFW